MALDLFFGELLFSFLYVYFILVIFNGIHDVLPMDKEGIKIDFKNKD